MPCSLHSIATATRTTDSISFDQTEMKPATKFNTLNILRCTEKNSSNFQLTAALKLSEQFLGITTVSFVFNKKTFWILLKQETMRGSGISWAICKSAPHSRQITTPAPQHSVFHRPDTLPATQPTVSKH